jgi:hypothetical protein
MGEIKDRPMGIFHQKRTIYLGIGLLYVLLIGCLAEFGTSNQALVETQSAMAVQLTIGAMDQQKNQQRAEEENAAQNAQATSAFMLAVQGTTQAQQATMEALQAAQEATQQAEQNSAQQQENQSANASAPTPTPQVQEDSSATSFDEWKKRATILLYEDMAGQWDTNRIILNALKALGLKPTVDDKDASGRFLMDLKSMGMGGKPWDLIISASEARTAIQGEFIPALIDNVNNGSSLIMEHWNIDSINLGQISNLLTMCGVELERDISIVRTDCTMPLNEDFLVLWPQAPENPILHNPNEGLRVSSMSQYWSEWYASACSGGLWPWPYDYGDELRLVPGSTSKVVLSTSSTSTDHHAALVSCQQERVIFWTSSTHNYAYNRVLPLWQNMIINALKARYNTMNKQ